MNQTEMRLDPLRQTWTLFSRPRAVKPPFGNEGGSSERSPFVAGLENLAPNALYTAKSLSGDHWQVRVVPSRAPVLRVEGQASMVADGFYDRMDGVGAQEVIVETPDLSAMESLPLTAICQIFAAWKTRMLDLARDSRMRSFFVVKNFGIPAGGTSPHSISQLIAMAVVPPSLRQKLGVCREFYARKKRSIFEDILREEIRVGSRLVYENNGFALFCPYASRAPFEQVIYPKRQCADFHGVTDQEAAQLADVLKTALLRLGRALDGPAYNLTLFTAPTKTHRADYWNTLAEDFRWHIEILPRLYFPHGVEIATDCHLNSVWPETAAAYLRKVET